MAGKSHYPVQRKFRVGAALPSVATDAAIFVDREMSKLNRRLMRQSRYYNVKVDIDADLPNGTIVNVYALQDTWMNQKAYQMAHKVFLENSKEELARLGRGSKARWNDFRVASGSSLSGPLLDAVTYAAGGSPTRLTVSEYNFSEVTDASGTTNTFRWEGTGANTLNIIDEYDKTGNANTQPPVPSTQAAYANLEDQIDDDQIQHLAGDGNAPPYNSEVIHNTCWMHVATLFVDGDGGGRLSSGFFTAPCGLLTLTYAGGANQTVVNEKICLEVKAGDYKGVHAPSMLE